MKSETYEALKALKSNNSNVELLQTTIEKQESRIDELISEVNTADRGKAQAETNAENLENEIEELKEKLTVPGFQIETLEDELKNAILLRLRNNLTLSQLEKVENFGKGMIAPGSTYRD